ncbi:hypothetical protein HFN89_00230 [Rhizobium laguerreae]|nr:hypothetical protein [Rhizobium laguerreae]
MQLSIKFPVMARALVKGARLESRMLVSHVHKVEVPSVSARETEVPIRTVVSQNELGLFHGMRELRMHDGRLYRYLDIHTQFGRVTKGAAMLDEAFGDFWMRRADYIASTDGRFDVMSDVNPLSKPIRMVIEDRLDAMAMNLSDGRNRTWPKLVGGAPAVENENLTLDAAMDDVQEVNRDDLEEAFAMHRAQADRLLLIDGELWYETTPPCIAVETLWRGGVAKNASVHARYRHLPEAMDHAITTVYYPLSAFAEAKDAAREMRARFRMAGVKMLTEAFEKDNLPAFEHGDHPAFQFDQSEDFVQRTGHALAVNILRTSIQRPEKFGDVDSGWLSKLAAAFATFNPLLGRDIDYASRLPALAETFLAVSPYKSSALAMLSYRQLRKGIEYAVEQLDNMPISVHGLAAAPARQM